MGKSGGGGAHRPSAAVRERRLPRPPGQEGADGRARPNIAPTKRPGGEKLPQLRAALVQHEKEIVGQKKEHARALDALGNVIVAKAGTKHGVTFTDSELKQMRGATFTHNHHYTTGLTMEDGRFAADHQLAEMRAVDATHTYSLRPSLITNWSQQYWDRVIQPSWNRNRDAVANEIRLQAWRTGKAPDDLASQQWHQVWERVARETGLRYARTGPASKARYVDRSGRPSEPSRQRRAGRA